jgi:hypothetical protein
MTESELSLPFVARGLDGIVNVGVYRNDEPSSVGSPAWAQGFPICEASVAWEAQGYRALLGWVQVVGMRTPGTGRQRQWVSDPLEVFDGLNTPFGFYGISPTLFDAPARRDRSTALDWHAESFLCVAPSAPMARQASPVTGFSWGFVMDGEQITATGPDALDRTAWARHRGLLRATYPGWSFETVS